jgi:hypothetical protein
VGLQLIIDSSLHQSHNKENEVFAKKDNLDELLNFLSDATKRFNTR